jgi:hypothetical protein
MRKISKKRIVIAASVMIAAAALAGYAKAGGPYKPVPNEEIYGVWTNDEYVQGKELVKVVMKPEGRYEQYNRYDDPKPYLQGKFVIEKKWTGDDGSTLYWIKKYMRSGGRFELARVNSDGSTYELVYQTERPYPPERMLSPGNNRYRLFNKN